MSQASGLPDKERQRLEHLHGRNPGDTEWVTVDELCFALNVPDWQARKIIRGYARQDSPVEKMLPQLLADDVGVTPRTLLYWERKGLPSVGFRDSKRYVSPICYQWIEQFQSESFSTGRSGFKRKYLNPASVAARVLGFPEETFA